MAYEIFEFETVERLADGARVPFEAVPNGSGPDRRRPTLGSVLIWYPQGYFKHTGHVAIITEATDTYVRIAEQNTHDRYWAPGTNYSRELPVHIDAQGRYAIEDTTATRAKVMGWMHVNAPTVAGTLVTPAADGVSSA